MCEKSSCGNFVKYGILKCFIDCLMVWYHQTHLLFRGECSWSFRFPNHSYHFGSSFYQSNRGSKDNYLNPEILKQTTRWWKFRWNNFVLFFSDVNNFVNLKHQKKHVCMLDLWKFHSFRSWRKSNKNNGSTTSVWTSKIFQHYGRCKGWRRFLPPHSPSSNRRLSTVLE